MRTAPGGWGLSRAVMRMLTTAGPSDRVDSTRRELAIQRQQLGINHFALEVLYLAGVSPQGWEMSQATRTPICQRFPLTKGSGSRGSWHRSWPRQPTAAGGRQPLPPPLPPQQLGIRQVIPSARRTPAEVPEELLQLLVNNQPDWTSHHWTSA